MTGLSVSSHLPLHCWLERVHQRVRQLRHCSAVPSRHTDAPVPGHKDMPLACHVIDLCFKRFTVAVDGTVSIGLPHMFAPPCTSHLHWSEASEREHPDLAGDEGPVLGRHPGLECCPQLLAHAPDAASHSLHLRLRTKGRYE